MINIMQWMRSSFSPHLLNRHIFGNTGGDSKNILSTLICGNRFAFQLPWCLIDKDTFDKHGPALVAKFEVHRSFEEEGKFIYSDEDAPSDNHQKFKGMFIPCSKMSDCSDTSHRTSRHDLAWNKRKWQFPSTKLVEEKAVR